MGSTSSCDGPVHCFRGEVDESCFDQILNTADLEISGDRFVLHWTQRWTEDLMYMQSVERVEYHGSVIVEACDDKAREGEVPGERAQGTEAAALQRRLLRVENQPVSHSSMTGIPLSGPMLTAFSYFRWMSTQRETSEPLASSEPLAYPDMELIGAIDGDAAAPTLKLRQASSNNKDDVMKLEDRATSYEMQRT